MKSYSLLIFALICSIESCHAKKFANPLAKIVQSISKFRINAVTVDRITDRPVELKTKQPLNVRIDDTWYDLSGWRKSHPAGEHWIDLYRGRDATEVMHAFHSTRGRGMYAKLPQSKSPDELNAQCAPVSQLTRNFRVLRQQLEDQGWWKRDMVHESKLWAIWLAITVSGLALAKTVPLLAVGLLALSQTQAGWLAHDYVHGVDKLSFAIRNFGPLGAGLSPTWWSDKHNKHHALTNEIGVDEDIATDPFLYIYPPNPSRDSPLRKLQGIIFPFPLSLLFIVWKFDSLKLILTDAMNGFKRKTQQELLFMVIHWATVISFVPAPVIAAYTFLSGFLTALIVTVTHQSEELFEEHNPDFVDAQFRSTRDAKCRTAFTEWLWGGMQYQLEHHLFPSMPRSKYPALAKVLQKFAVENNVDYRITDEFELIGMNIDMYRRMAKLPSSSTAKHYEGKDKSWGGRGEVVSY